MICLLVGNRGLSPISLKKVLKLLSNYRPITLLNTVYKIWTTIISNKIAPFVNILTEDTQYAYKANKSTIDVIYFVKRNFIKIK